MIRWDAWYDPSDGRVAQAMEASLGPSRYHDRMPFFGQVTGDNKVRIDGYSPDIMNHEIEIATSAGIDYWAFVGYLESDPMNRALALYLESKAKGKLGFCMIGCVANGGTVGHISPRTLHEVKLFSDDRYVRVLGDRPLYYILSAGDQQIKQEWGGRAGLSELIKFIRSRSVSSRSGNPYIVWLGGNPDRSAQLAKEIGCDAISAYEIARPRNGASYQTLAADAEAYWNDLAATGTPMIPTAMTGWDQRPLIENPPFWDLSYLKKGAGMELFYQRGSPVEVARHLEAALIWSQRHSAESPAATVLVYAWNECGEGFGALIPTYLPDKPSGDTSRLDAVRLVLTK